VCRTPRLGRPARRPLGATILLLAITLLLAAPLFGQQEYVSRYDAFVGYAFLNSSNINLLENGVQVQVGVRPRTWFSIGFDYTHASGDLSLTPNLLLPSIQQTLGAQFGQLAAAGLLPAGYSLVVPASSVSQTFSLGPQLAYRHFTHFTLFLRPDLGAIHEAATPHAGDPIAAAVVAQLAPSGTKTDWKVFYGFGGGIDIIVSQHLALRTQADLVHDHLFDDLLQNGRWTVRFSIGPAFNFGKNIVQ